MGFISAFKGLRAKFEVNLTLKDVEHVINERHLSHTMACAVTRW